uniref:Sieve element occlusion C-terminal domain-containing protein n=1 Tax=Kalanchoe fedtschenkoi TaxID=63787 RepID=A0A7N0VHM9_KALFE
MSNTADDEGTLLKDIKRGLGDYVLEHHISNRIYPIVSFILKSVTAHRLDATETALPSVSEERVAESTEAELDFIKSDFIDIGNILKEIESASSTETDQHVFGVSLPRILRRQDYTLNFILVGTLAAFAVTHGVWLLFLKFVCSDSSNEDMMMVLKRVEELFITLRKHLGKQETNDAPDFYLYISLLSSSVTRKPRDNWKSMDSLYSLIRAMLEVTFAAHLFLKNIHKFILQSLKDEFDSLVLLSIYWITRGVFASSSQCNALPKNGYVIQDSQNLMDICDKLNSIYKRLQSLEKNGRQYMDDEKIAEAYQIPHKKGSDNCYALMALFGRPEGLNFSHCVRKESKRLQALSALALRHNILLLLISGLDISLNEISFLEDVYAELKIPVEQKCELIWVPIHNGSWTTSSEEKYKKLLRMMPWYTKIIEFVRHTWKFHKKPIIAVLNAGGNVVCPNAIHLIHIWGAKAFPFTKPKERSLWAGEARLGSLVMGFDPRVSNMLGGGKWVILCGGNDTEWIRDFVVVVQEAASDLSISIEMIIIGRTADNEQIDKIIYSKSPVTPDYYYPHSRKTWHLWTRLESLLISMHQRFIARDYSTDPSFQEVKKLLSYASAESWACLITPSSDVMIHGLGDTMLQAFTEYKTWKKHLHTKDFTKFLKNHIEQLQSQGSGYPCSQIILNTDNKDVIESMKCPHCVQCHGEADSVQMFSCR